jgi:membrane protein required for colicin V production
MDLAPLGVVDLAAVVLVAVALLRGLWIGLVREAFSLAGVAAAILAVRAGAKPLGGTLATHAPFALPPLAATVCAGVLLALGTLVAMAVLGRIVRRGARFAGLGLADRLGGAVLGAAEGALVVGLALLVGGALVGRSHPALVDSHALEILESAERLARVAEPTAPDVAAPPPRRR